ncbi:MAG: adenosylmethionine decarboxylase [Bacteroidota bacterium]
MSTLGRHLLAEYHTIEFEKLADPEWVAEAMQEAARQAGAQLVHSKFHHFAPLGVSGVVLIKESHLTIHTWPELGYAAVDVFTCGANVDPWLACRYLERVLAAQKCSIQEIERGP